MRLRRVVVGLFSFNGLTVTHDSLRRRRIISENKRCECGVSFFPVKKILSHIVCVEALLV